MDTILRILLSSAFILSIAISLTQFFSRASVAYELRRVRNRIWSILIKSFESGPLDEEVTFVVSAHGGLKAVEVCAGPWLDGIEVVSSARRSEDKMFKVKLSGIPIEGVIPLRVETQYAGVVPDVSAPGSQIRGFRRLENWHKYRWQELAVRSLLGTGAGLSSFWLVDLLLSAVLDVSLSPFLLSLPIVVIAPFVLAISMPFQGKEVIPGYLGWAGTSVIERADMSKDAKN